MVSSQQDTSVETLQPRLKIQAKAANFPGHHSYIEQVACHVARISVLFEPICLATAPTADEDLERVFGILTVVFTTTLAVDCTRASWGTLLLLFVGLRFGLAPRLPSCPTSTGTIPIPVDISGYE